MTKTKIVDAVKTEAPAACGIGGGGVTNVTVPLKMDTSMLAKAMQAAAAQPQTVRIDPAAVIKEAGNRMEDLYARFNVLRQLGAELNGKNFSDPVPPTVKIDDVAITFRVIKDGKVAEPVVANIKNVVCVGDISNLLSTELGTIILALSQEAAAVKETATATEETCNKARQQWETNNPDRKIVSRDVENQAQATDDAPSV